MKRVLALMLLAALAVLVVAPLPAASAAQVGEQSEWYPEDEVGNKHVAFYFVYSETCAYCARAKPFIDYLEEEYEWLQVIRVGAEAASQEQVELVLALAEEVGEDIVGVPTYLFCEQMDGGFDSVDGKGADLERELLGCYEALVDDGDIVADPNSDSQSDADEDLTVPVLGQIDADRVSLPIFTVAVAGLDAFNPCAFFVLLFLLSLLVHARSRWRMALVGGVFVVMSGVMYFAFMAAWLNVFLVTGQLRWITAVAGTIALVIALFNMKDYFAPDTAGSLSIPDAAKPGLFARMRKLTTGDSMPTVLAGTVALAAVANSYELLCTAGFPLVFTRVLTLNELSTSSYYSYLILYNLVYVIPLLVIVGVFVWTLGSRKLSEGEGQFLKLMSGMMMLGLGLLLLIRPTLLENMFAAVGILAGAVAVSFTIWAIRRSRGATA